MSRAAPTIRAFEPHEIALSATASAAVVTGFLALLVFAGQNKTHVKAVEPPQEKLVPMQVRPVLDELPLLKLGGKKKAKLPDMWKKNPPVQRFEASSAPSTKAAKTPEAIPDTPLAKPDAAAPPPDAEVAKQVDQTLLDAGPDSAPTVEGEGSPDGVKEGTETDPLKARAISAYQAKLIAWFNARFRPPESGIPCAELKKMSSGVNVSVGANRQVAGYTVASPSGNAIFDERVRSTLDRVVGEELPPPPPLYPDILSSNLSFRLSGSKATCDDKPATPSPTPPAAPAPEAPAPTPPAPAPEPPGPESP
ncbi:MAG: energy transducer TonB [Myxococcota bacterium]